MIYFHIVTSIDIPYNLTSKVHQVSKIQNKAKHSLDFLQMKFQVYTRLNICNVGPYINAETSHAFDVDCAQTISY